MHTLSIKMLLLSLDGSKLCKPSADPCPSEQEVSGFCYEKHSSLSDREHDIVNKNSQGGLSFKLTVKECMYTCEGRKKPSGGREKDQKKMF